jgi:hypothetical protein
VIRTRSSRPIAARVSAWIGVLCTFGCHVYDPDLLEGAQQRGIREDGAEEDASQADAADGDAAASCGDGVVNEDEACDIAIGRGKSGACPDGCSGGSGCMRRELEGEGCDARCVEREITEAASDDGCCPADTDYHADNDCPARCGNDQLEPGERCDPAETCPSEDACKNTDACERTEFVGDADSCSAHCEVTAITSCLGGDGCCPAGCDLERDSDCLPSCSEGQSCPGEGMETPVMPPPPPFDCGAEHNGSACRACSCSRCGPETEVCLNDEPNDAMLCRGAIDCSERVQCTARGCYCGAADSEACAMDALGACETEWLAAAQLGSNVSPRLVLFAAGTPSLTLGKAVRLIECRARNCAEECGLVGR